jgi:hypothetical protein
MTSYAMFCSITLKAAAEPGARPFRSMPARPIAEFDKLIS